MTQRDRNEDAALDKTLDASQRAETPPDPEPRSAVVSPASPGHAEVPTADLRRYRIHREFARGGLGRILEADDTTLGRKVAIKELRVSGGRGKARFLREAMVTARLQHPSIVPLYDVGKWESGEPYYSMKLVSGRPLDAVIASATNLDARLALVPHVIAVADAMAYAHSQRIIHRDLKPANVLVGDFGETVVIDWGLAKDLADGSADDRVDEGPFRTTDAVPGLTAAGEVLGTPVYMAPEQAMGEPLDERADVYAIGAILYELLTGVWPHHGASSAQVIARLICGDTVTPIEVQQPAVPPDLVTIVRKAMAYQREERYRTASELASDLRRFQTGQLVAAHHYSRGMLARRWVRRHRAPVAVASVLIAALGATVTMSVRSIVHERDATRSERDKLILAQARGDLELDPTAAIAWLKTYPASGTEQDSARDLALEARAAGVATYVLPLATIAGMGQFSPDGRRFAQPGPDGVRVLDLATGASQRPISSAIESLTWAPDGKRLLVTTHAPERAGMVVGLDDRRVVSLAGKVDIWRQTDVDYFVGDAVIAPSIDQTLVQYSHDGGAGRPLWVPFPLLGYSSKGDRFASVSSDGAMVWWDAAAPVAHPLAAPAGVSLATDGSAYAIVGDGTRVVAGTKDGRLCVWSLRDGNVAVLPGSGAAIAAIQVSSDGNTVISQSSDNVLVRWQLVEGTATPLPQLGDIRTLDLSRDGKWLAVATGHDVLLLDVATGAYRRIGHHPGILRNVAMSSDDKWIASDGEDGTTRLWQLPDDAVSVYREHDGRVTTLAFAPDGRTLSAGGEDRVVSLWRTTDHERYRLEGHADLLLVAAFVDQGKILVTGGFDGTLRQWDVTAARAIGAPLDVHAGAVASLAALRTARSVIAGYAHGDVRQWDLASATSKSIASTRDIPLIAVSPDDRLVAVADGAGGVQLVALSGSAPRIDATELTVLALKFSPDGRTLVAGTKTGEVIAWNLATGVATQIARREGAVRTVVVSADSAWLAARSGEGDVGWWKLATGEARTLLGNEGLASRIALLPDGRLLTGGIDGTVRLWGPDGHEQSVQRIGGQVTALAVDDADTQIAAGSKDGVVYRWSLGTFGGAPAGLAAFLDALTRARLDASLQHLQMP